MFDRGNDDTKKGIDIENQLFKIMIAFGLQVIETRKASDSGAPLVEEDRDNKLRLPDFFLLDRLQFVEAKSLKPSNWAEEPRFPICGEAWDDYCEISEKASVTLVIYEHTTDRWFYQQVSEIEPADRSEPVAYKKKDIVFLNRSEFNHFDLFGGGGLPGEAGS